MIKAKTRIVSVDYEDLSVAWHDGQFYNPASRHRRRIILNLLSKIKFKTVLEIGCGQPYLLEEIKDRFGSDCTGTDISKALILANRKEFPEFNFEVLDIVNKNLNKKYDLVVASEILEHVSDYKKALSNIAKMANKYILITVPSSKVFPIDESIGHFRHYEPKDMIEPLDSLGFKTIKCFKWGFPFHNFYKYAINSLATPEKMRNTFAESQYGLGKILITKIIYGLFFLNLKIWGFQLVILAKRKK